MSTRTLQPSEYEIQREVEALRDIRRRSITPGALTIDPDLPNQSPPSSPTGYWSGTASSGASISNADGDSSSSSHEDSLSSEHAGVVGIVGTDENSNNPTDDPFHLFWVPASLHPEIAPAEFRAFLKEHSRSPSSVDGSSTPERSNSVTSLSSSSSLGRKKSMLSRQYRPSENDGVENETVVPLRRNRSSLYTNHGPQLTINDLQKLEELAEEASESDDPTKLRNILRRSLSMNMSPSAIDRMDDIPEMGDEADVPIIVPPPGQILRRTARTRIRKPGLPGDGGGHRFNATRRGATARTSTTSTEQRTSSDFSSSDHGDSTESNTVDTHRRVSDEVLNHTRPDSYSDIYGAYARDDDDDAPEPIIITSPPPVSVELPESPPPPAAVQPALLEALGPVIQQPQPQRLLSPAHSPLEQPPSRTPSPSEHAPLPTTETPPRLQSPPSHLSTSPSPPARQREDKNKKGIFGKWGSDKGGKKSGKERDGRERMSAEKEEKEKEKEKESGFFGSLFGGSKKKQESEYPPPLIHTSTSGREAAQALLGASKSSKNYVPPRPLDLHLEAVQTHMRGTLFILSHIKLANPRRPLYEQVLISNLMFWYLGVINKAQSTPGSPPNGQTGGTPANNEGGGQNGENDSKADEQKEREKEIQEKEQQEKERQERERREREIESKKRETGRRGSLTKTPAAGSPGRRVAEMPVKGPQYEKQHRVMEQEFGGYNQSAPMGRSSSAPGGVAQPSRQQSLQFTNTPPALVQSQPQNSEPLYYSADHINNQQQRPGLPPGAMPPVDNSSRLPTSQTPSPSRNHNPPSPPPDSHRRSRSPPRQYNQQPLTPNRYNSNTTPESFTGTNGNKSPGRSLSATAVPSPPAQQVNGKVRKGNSAHAVPSYGRRPHTSEGQLDPNGAGEEEDVPLALWQQQRRR
ncbi:hypothetical protein BD779DRAFT_1784286 [Infundibulicybe gibba]|nr:hypothetical protein BD779DRAFT_1784286 [Infundibulicybe gibba]